jgi:hypothetical protein
MSEPPPLGCALGLLPPRGQLVGVCLPVRAPHAADARVRTSSPASRRRPSGRTRCRPFGVQVPLAPGSSVENFDAMRRGTSVNWLTLRAGR